MVPARSPAAAAPLPGVTLCDDQPVVAGEREGAGEALGDGRGVEAEVGVLDASGGEELLDDGLDGVDRDREADAGGGGRGGGLGRVELRADPDHLAAGVDERARRSCRG